MDPKITASISDLCHHALQEDPLKLMKPEVWLSKENGSMLTYKS